VLDKWLEIGLLAGISILAYFGRREMNRIDTKADQHDVKEALKRLDSHISECREQNEKVSDTLLHVSTAIARIEGRLGK